MTRFREALFFAATSSSVAALPSSCFHGTSAAAVAAAGRLPPVCVTGEERKKGDNGKRYTKSNLPIKVCVSCGRPFEWRKKWERDWDDVKFCSERCRRHRKETGLSPKGETVLSETRRRFWSNVARTFTAAAAAASIALTASPPAALAAASGAPRPQKGEIEAVLRAVEWPEEWPFTADDFARLDETDDSAFYDEPKLVEHIDVPAQQAMEAFYGCLLNNVARDRYGSSPCPLDVLDLCSSWVSHLPQAYAAEAGGSGDYVGGGGNSGGGGGRDGGIDNIGRDGRVVGLGMNAAELRLNKQLSEWRMQDLNRTPKLPYDDGSFDAVVCALSIDYLTHPLAVMREAGRVLRPGGAAAVVFSNRLFLSKAVGAWTGAADVDHVYTVGAYFHYCGGGFGAPTAFDLSPHGTGDPLYAVVARKI